MSEGIFQARIISSLEKCFCDEPVQAHPVMKKASMLRNERFSFQLVYRDERTGVLPWENYTEVEAHVPEGLCCRIRSVEQVPVMMPVYPHSYDDNYLRTTPGLYPDPLLPLRYNGQIRPQPNVTFALWIDITAEKETPAGDYPVTLRLRQKTSGTILAEETLNLTVIAADLPEQTLLYTQWFHADCLADYYNVPVFSERHWEIIEHFVKTAAETGMNMLLTPIFTPPLDTVVGGERPTVQLLDITRENGEYRFGFEKLDRWVEMAHRCGITHFEMAHLFTQWGAKHAPKIMVEENGRLVKAFGWETDAAGDEYAQFLRAMLPALTAHLKELGIAQNCIFHISDEPSEEMLDSYVSARNIAAPLLEGFPIMDALSNITFYKSGAVEHPIPANNHIEPFLEANIPGLWTYYCCSQNKEVSNRFVAMPSARTRILGTQLYKYNIAGFLHWGYNFYYSQYSIDRINPFLTDTGDYFAPAGDPFVVYPAQDGTPLETLRLLVFADAIQDMRAMQLCEQLCGRQTVLDLIEEGSEKPLTFSEYPHDAAWLLALREKINAAIAKAL